MFGKILIANRGEIALRIMRTCRTMGIATVAVYSEADSESRHVAAADEAVMIGASSPRDSYLNHENILEAARSTSSDAVHPGYGFLAENSEFAARCELAGVKFIGPSPTAIAKMGDKVQARQLMLESGVSLVPGSDGFSEDQVNDAGNEAGRVGYPILIKASAGGGGIGMIRVESAEKLRQGIEQAQRRAEHAFGDPTIYIEKEIQNPRHIEVQLLGDEHGNLIHLFERECSVQRRHQKVVEEALSPSIDGETRQNIYDAALKAGQSVDYNSVGTVEFVVDQENNYYFLEMNTRIQVEHPVTEMITGVDLVEQQIIVANGSSLTLKQGDVTHKGHAIELRIYAEDPETFFPSPGMLGTYKVPVGEHIRVDDWVQEGVEITPYYDPMLAKLVAWGDDRSMSIERAMQALENYVISGVKTNLPLHKRILSDKSFLSGSYDTAILQLLK